MNKTIATFQIQYHQFLNPQGEVVQDLPQFANESAQLIALYRGMVLARSFDAKCIALQRTGKLGTYASFLGQEAIGIGAASAMRTEDVLLPSYRESAMLLQRGVTMEELFSYWGGDERGNDFQTPRKDFPICITIGTQVVHAVGVAYAMKLRNEKRVAVAVCGDGGTSKGDFYEGINAAGVWHLPMIMLINNNQWAISAPRSLQSAAQTLAQKAIAAGFDGLQVDGNDVIAVRHVMEQALAKARDGGGPTLIEALSYRLSDHTTADDASRYRDAKELSERWSMEPIARLRHYLAATKVWGKTDEEELLKTCAEEVNRSVETYTAIPPPGNEEIFKYLYATLPAVLATQRDEVVTGDRHG